VETGEGRVLKTRIWLKRLFQRYYSRMGPIYLPADVHRREFGFGSFSKKITIRHRSFPDERALLDYIKKEAPAHCNHSIARYRFPGEGNQMEEKERLGSDLIFDIDVGDLNLPCAKDHPSNWVCEECFAGLKREIVKLRQFLRRDFGFGDDDMTINFSGSRGYHLRIQDARVQGLEEAARKELVGYLTLDIDLDEIIREIDGRIFGPKAEENGLRGRIAKGVIEEVLVDDNIQNREHLAEQIRQGNWGAFPKGFGPKKIKKYIMRTAVNIPVDAKVTTDMSHLIRMADTLHGGSSLKAKVVGDLDGFHPLEECFVFGDSKVKMDVIQPVPKFRAKGQEFGPFEEGKVELPEFVAAYLGAKGFCVVG